MESNRRPSRACVQVLAASLDEAQEAAREFTDTLDLATVDRLRGDQFSADSERHCARDDEVGRVLLMHPAGGHQRNLRVHAMEGGNVRFTANLRAGNNLDEIGFRFPCGDDFRRGQRAGNDHHILFGGKLDHGQMQPIAGQKLRTSIKTCLCGFRIRHPARPHNDAGNRSHQMR